MHRKEIARDTLQILDQGGYQAPDGPYVDLASLLAACVENTECYDPDMLAGIRDEILAQPPRFDGTVFEVANETSLQGSLRLAASQVHGRVGVLNFASARNPGGGFINGAQAQEETLARSSGLYPSLLKCRGNYNYHRRHRSGLYSDRMIFSPGCPVFRRDDGALLEHPYLVDFINSPAPNAGSVRRNQPSLVEKIESVLRERAAKVLALAVHHRCDALVLGAWGCGVFRNDPAMVAGAFHDLLVPDDAPYRGRIRTVLFSVLDTSESQRTYRTFTDCFAA